MFVREDGKANKYILSKPRCFYSKILSSGGNYKFLAQRQRKLYLVKQYQRVLIGAKKKAINLRVSSSKLRIVEQRRRP